MPATRRLFRFLGPYRLWAVLAPLFMVLEVAMDLMQPRLMQVVVDTGIARGDRAAVQSAGLGMLACALVGIVGGMGCTLFAVLAGQGFGADLRSALFRKVQALSFGNLDRLKTGPLITRLTNDVVQVQELVMMLLRIMVRVPLLLVGSLTMAIWTSPRLALLFIPLVPVVAAIVYWIVRRMFPLFAEAQARLDALNSVVQDNLSGIRVVKAFAREDYESERFGAANADLAAMNTTAARVGVITMPLMMLVLNLGVAAALWMGGVGVVRGGMQVGQIIAFVNYLTQTLFSLIMVSMLVVRLSRSEASAERIEEVLAAEPTIPPPPESAPPLDLQGRVAFEGVTFAYDGAEADPVLCDISFAAEPGETVAVMGATGSGKSSLVHLVPRFYDVTAGRVTIDGADVRSLTAEQLSRAVGVALQESVLFSGTIRDNIRYGRPDADDAEVVAAARTAHADEFIRALTDGYDTVLGQRGVNLSGGQKQRIAIARALLARPAVLILDDSLSAVDVETEAAIQNALAAHPSRPTRIVVAQRVSAAITADRILLLDDGRLVANGTHSELLNTSPIYREIWESQVDGGATANGA